MPCSILTHIAAGMTYWGRGKWQTTSDEQIKLCARRCCGSLVARQCFRIEGNNVQHSVGEVFE